MGQTCLACSHPQRAEIDEAIIEGSPNSRIASKVGVGEYVIRRHKKFHLLATLNNARNAQQRLNAQAPVNAVLAEARRPLDLLEEVESLLLVAKGLLSKASDEGKYGPAVEAVGKITRLLELTGRLSGDLQSGTTINTQLVITQEPQWVKLRSQILTALEPHPQALEAVLQALSASNGEGPEPLS